jgi:uncharacterized protein
VDEIPKSKGAGKLGQFVRILIIVLVLWLIVGWIKRTIKRTRQRRNSTDDLPRAEITDTVVCAYCGVHLPKSLALSYADQMYCSEQHREAEHEDGGLR